MENLIDARQLSKSVTAPDGGVLNILSGLALSVKQGEALAILGASGSGKSTLLGLLAGLDHATGGDIALLGESLIDKDEDQRALLRAGKVGFVFQSFQLLQGMTALQNVALALQLANRSDAMEQATQLLSDVGLAERAEHLPQQLSGGEQQRVALARAFAGDPQLLFADEPTGNLDAKTGEHIVDLMFSLRDRCQTTLVLVTHDETLAARCDRVLRLDNGLLEEVAC